MNNYTKEGEPHLKGVYGAGVRKVNEFVAGLHARGELPDWFPPVPNPDLELVRKRIEVPTELVKRSDELVKSIRADAKLSKLTRGHIIRVAAASTAGNAESAMETLIPYLRSGIHEGETTQIYAGISKRTLGYLEAAVKDLRIPIGQTSVNELLCASIFYATENPDGMKLAATRILGQQTRT